MFGRKLLSALALAASLAPLSATEAAAPNTVYSSVGLLELKGTMVGLGLPFTEHATSEGTQYLLVRLGATQLIFAAMPAGCKSLSSDCAAFVYFFIDSGPAVPADLLNRINAELPMIKAFRNEATTNVLGENIVGGGAVQANLDMQVLVFLKGLADYLSLRQTGQVSQLSAPDGKALLMLQADPREALQETARFVGDLAAWSTPADINARYNMAIDAAAARQ